MGGGGIEGELWGDVRGKGSFRGMSGESFGVILRERGALGDVEGEFWGHVEAKGSFGGILRERGALG